MQAPRPRWSWRSNAARRWIYQVLAVALIAAVVLFLASNTANNMRARGMQSGFDFLSSAAGFDIGESLIAFDSSETYWSAYLVGVTNTLRVAMLGILLTTVLGTLIGVGRLSRNMLVRGLCRMYVEVFRNVPLLLQLLMWYLLFSELLPSSTEPLRWGPFFLSKGGLTFPLLQLSDAPGIGWHWNVPVQGEFAVEGGGSLTPELLSLLLGLVVYTAAFVSEVVRSGIQSVARGQAEAASALGLSQRQTLRLVILPQALRVIIPPLTNQFLGLTKNSSLAVAIGYPDVVSIANTAINQTGRAVECIAIIMVVYLSTSLFTSLLMGWYNRRAAIAER